jgi:hypothetical protein
LAAEANKQVHGVGHADTQYLIASLVGIYDRRKASAKAEPWIRETAEWHKQQAGADSVEYAAALGHLGENLLSQAKWAEAESSLRECLAIRRQKTPDDYQTFCTQSMLGASLVGQKKYADAEPSLLQGYQGMKQREASIEASDKRKLTEALERVVQLYEVLEQKDEAAKWRNELEVAKKDAAR